MSGQRSPGSTQPLKLQKWDVPRSQRFKYDEWPSSHVKLTPTKQGLPVDAIDGRVQRLQRY